MATLLLTHPVPFAAGAIRAALGATHPAYRWRAGDEDDRDLQSTIAFTRTQTVMGRLGDELVMVAVEPVEGGAGADPALPPHGALVRIGRASTPDDALAMRVALVIASALASSADPGARLQLEPDGSWLSAREMETLVSAIGQDPTLKGRLALGERLTPAPAAASPDAPPRPTPSVPPRRGVFGRKVA